MKIRVGLLGGIVLLIILVILAIATQSESIGALVLINTIVLLVMVTRTVVPGIKGSMAQKDDDSSKGENPSLAEDEIDLVISETLLHITRDDLKVPVIAKMAQDRFTINNRAIRTLAFDIAFSSTAKIKDEVKASLRKKLMIGLDKHNLLQGMTQYIREYHKAIIAKNSDTDLPIRIGEVFSENVIGRADPEMVILGGGQFSLSYNCALQVVDLLSEPR